MIADCACAAAGARPIPSVAAASAAVRRHVFPNPRMSILSSFAMCAAVVLARHGRGVEEATEQGSYPRQALDFARARRATHLVGCVLSRSAADSHAAPVAPHRGRA